MSLQLLINGLSLGAVYALVAVGFAVVFNILKFSNFSHGGIMTVTAYVGLLATRYFDTSLLQTLVVAASAGALLALLGEIVAFRRNRAKNGPIIYYFVSSITLGILFENIIVIFFSTNFYFYPRFFQTTVLQFGDYFIPTTDLTMFIISVCLLVTFMLILYKTNLGIALRAISFDVDTAKLMGVDVTRVIQLTFIIAGCLGGISGVFLGINYTLTPQLGQMVVKGFVASVIGGLGNIQGAVIGAFLLGIVELTLIRLVGSPISPVFIFVIMLVFLLLRPQGIAGSNVQGKA